MNARLTAQGPPHTLEEAALLVEWINSDPPELREARFLADQFRRSLASVVRCAAEGRQPYEAQYLDALDELAEVAQGIIKRRDLYRLNQGTP